jgi:hypothetical protein
MNVKMFLFGAFGVAMYFKEEIDQTYDSFFEKEQLK